MLLFEEKMISGKTNSPTLRSLLDAKPSMRDGLALFAALCRSLQTQGATPHDLSPDKIICEANGAFFFSAPPAVIPGDRRSLPGAPGYLAPERLRGEKHPSLKSDLFSLGAILYELLAGRRAFLGKNDMELVLATLDGKVMLAS